MEEEDERVTRGAGGTSGRTMSPFCPFGARWMWLEITLVRSLTVTE